MHKKRPTARLSGLFYGKATRAGQKSHALGQALHSSEAALSLWQPDPVRQQKKTARPRG